MEFRKVFDTIPGKFDKWRPRYCKEAFDTIIEYSGIGVPESALEIGPGTGQATEPILKTGCDYLAIELGEHLAEFTKNKFSSYTNFHLINDDFITHDFAGRSFDLVYSAATIQWIPETIAFPKIFGLLKNGGTLAMMMTEGEYRSSNERLYTKIEKIYSEYFHPEILYAQKFTYANAVNYGFTEFERHEFPSQRRFTADEYVEYCGTHCDHIVLKEPDRSKFFEGLRDAVSEEGNQIVFNDKIILYLARKPKE